MSDDPSSGPYGQAVPSHTFTFAFLEGVPVLSFCLTVINTPIYYELPKHRLLLLCAWEICAYHPKQGNEGAVQTLLYKQGVTCWFAAFILTVSARTSQSLASS